MPETPALTATTATVAAILDLTPRRIRQIAEARGVAPIKRDQWNLLTLLPAYFAGLKESLEKPDFAETRVAGARATEIERRMARDGEGLITLNEALATVDDITAALLAALRDLLSGIAGKDGRELDRIEGIVAPTIRRLEISFAKSRAALANGKEPNR